MTLKLCIYQFLFALRLPHQPRSPAPSSILRIFYSRLHCLYLENGSLKTTKNMIIWHGFSWSFSLYLDFNLCWKITHLWRQLEIETYVSIMRSASSPWNGEDTFGWYQFSMDPTECFFLTGTKRNSIAGLPDMLDTFALAYFVGLLMTFMLCF